MSDLSKKIVTYEAMEKYTEAIKQYISNNAGSTGTGLSDTDTAKLTHSVGLPIGNTGIHTWDNMCTEGDTEEQHVGSIKIRHYDDEIGDYYTINGTYFNVCQCSEHESDYSGDYYVLLIGTMRYDTEDEKHATDASLIGLNIWSDGESVSIYFNKPIASLGLGNSGSGGGSNTSSAKPEREYGNYDEGYDYDEDKTVYVSANTSAVINVEGNNYIDVVLIGARTNQVNEYSIIIHNRSDIDGANGVCLERICVWNDSSGDIYCDLGGSCLWANGDIPILYEAGHYELNIKVVVNEGDFEENDEGENVFNIHTATVYGTYVKY